MRFVVILICLALLRWTRLGKSIREYKLYKKYIKWQCLLVNKINNKSYCWLIVLLPLPLLIFLISYLLTNRCYNILNFVFCVLILLYTLGTYNLIDGKVKEENNQEKDSETTAEENSKNNFATMIVEISQNIFSVIFWFAVLGLFGAALYRISFLLNSCNSSSDSSHNDSCDCSCCGGKLVKKIQEILDWLPMRLFSLSAAFISHFIAVITVWAKCLFNSSKKLLEECSRAALFDDAEPQNIDTDHLQQKILALTDRVLIVWLVFIGLAVVFI